jgi:hypothetical protein
LSAARTGGRGPPQYQLPGDAVRAAEDALTNVDGDEDCPALLQVKVAVVARARISSGKTSTLERLGEQGDGGQKFDNQLGLNQKVPL